MKRFIASLLTAFVLFPLPALAGYLATGTIGQSDGDGDPDYASDRPYNGPGPTGFNAASQTALDPTDHRLFVADSGNGRILVFNLDSSNELLDLTADNVLGREDFYAYIEASVPEQDVLGGIAAIVFDDVYDRLFVSDYQFKRVLVFDVADITDGEDAVNVIGVADFVTEGDGDGQEGVDPFGLAYDPTGERLFVGNGNTRARILVFDADPSVLIPDDSGSDGPNAVAIIGQDDFDTYGLIDGRRHVNDPAAMVYDDARDLLFEVETNNNRLMVFDASVANLASEGNGLTDGIYPDASYILGQISFTTYSTATTARRFYFPIGLGYDTGGETLYVSEYGNNRVTVFDVSLANLASEAVGTGISMNAEYVLGQPDFTTNTTPTDNTATTMSSPDDILVDAGNDLIYVVDDTGTRVLIFDVSTISNNEAAIGVLGQTDVNGDASFTGGENDNAPNALGVASTAGVALDSVHHRLFVGDSNSRRILVFELDTEDTLTEFTADFVLGQVDMKGNAFALSQSGLSSVRDLVYDAENDRLFAADRSNNRVMVWDFSLTPLADGIDAQYVLGQPNFTSDTANASINELNRPEGLCIDTDNDILYVVENNNNRVVGYELASLATGMDASYVVGQEDFDTGTGDTTRRTLDGPTECAFDDANDRLFVTEESNNRVMVFDAALVNLASEAVGLGTSTDASHVLGHATFDTDISGTSASEFEEPLGVAYAADTETLFVADTSNNRVVLYDVADITDGEDAVAVLGQDMFTSGSSGLSQDEMDEPIMVSYDAGNRRLYVADGDNRRFLVYDFIDITTTDVPDAVSGVPYDADIVTEDDQGSVSFSLYSDSLPPGLSVGSLTGTPTTPGTYTFTLAATDDNGPVGSFVSLQTYTMTVAAGAGGSTGSFLPGFGPLATPMASPGAPMPSAAPSAGDIVTAFAATSDPDVYAVNPFGFKRLFLNPAVLALSDAVASYADITQIPGTRRDALPTANLYQNCEAGSSEVHALEVTGEDTGLLHHVMISGDEATRQDPNFFKKVFCINSREFNWYPKSSTPYTSVNGLPVYRR